MNPQNNIQQSKSDRKKVRDRKKNLMKKAEELSTLCGVDVCLILYQRQSSITETWPQDPEQVKRIVTRYRANPRDASIPAAASLEMKEETNDNKALDMLYPTWDDRLDYCSEEQLFRLVASLDAKLEASTKRIDSLTMSLGPSLENNNPRPSRNQTSTPSSNVISDEASRM